MGQRTLGPLTFRQRVFWLLAVAVVIFDAIALIMTTWPAGACGCGG
jgi:hypothetical protein